MNKILVLALLFSLASCSIFRKAEKSGETGPSLSEKETRNYLKNPSESVDWLSAKYGLSVSGSQNLNLNVRLRMKKDSAIWLSISPGLGIEVARVLARPDSVWFLNKLGKTYFQGTPEELSDRLNLPLSFELMQAVFLGEPNPADFGRLVHYFLFEEEAMLSSLQAETFKAIYSGTKDIDGSELVYGFKKDKEKLSSVYYYQGKKQVFVDYESYVLVNKPDNKSNVQIPSMVNARYVEVDPMDLQLMLETKSLEGPFPLNLNIPSSYAPF